MNYTLRKHPDSAIDFRVNFANELRQGETVVSATANVTAGDDPVSLGSPVVSSPVVMVNISGGTDGETDTVVILATTSAGEVLDATITVIVSSASPGRTSYSNPDALAARIGPRLYAQLTAESGDVADDTVAQFILDSASVEIDIRLGNRYVVPVLAPPGAVLRLAGLEEQIALWFLWVRRGIGDQESAASAAKVGYDAAIKLLDAIAAGTIDLTGVANRPPDTDDSGLPSGWRSNVPVYTSENFRHF